MEVAESGGDVKASDQERPTGNRWIRIAVPVLAAAAVFVVFFLTDWRLEIGPTKQAVAVPNRLAIMYFENLADPQDSLRLGEIATHLLITDLSESQHVEVVSSQRLYDILKLLGRKGEKRINKDIATEVATNAQARWMLTGSLLQFEPQMILVGQLIDVAHGTVIESQRIVAEAGEDLFALVDRLTLEIKKDLALPTLAPDEIDRPIAYVTTHSLEAYRYFIEGREAFYDWNHKEAVYKFREALRHDPKMAMAYFYLSFIGVSLRDPEMKGLIANAVEHIDHVTQRERWNIQAVAALFGGRMDECMEWGHKIAESYPDDKMIHFWLGYTYLKYLDEPVKAIKYLNRAVELDSLFKNPYSMLAQAYEKLGDHEKALQSIDRIISISPQDAYGYVYRGNIYRSTGEIDSALAAYRNALQRDPDHTHALRRAGFLSLFKREYDSAAANFQRLAGSFNKTARAEGRTGQALIYLYQGRYREGLAILDDGLAADELEQNTNDPASLEKRYIKVFVQSETGDLHSAIAGLETYNALYRDNFAGKGHDCSNLLVLFLAEMGDFHRAESVLTVINGELDSTNQVALFNHSFGQGALAYARRDYENASQHFRKSLSFASGFSRLNRFPTLVMLARSRLKAGDNDSATEQFENLLAYLEWGRALHSSWSVKLHYWLGKSYEQVGLNDDAIAQYEEFLKFRQDADPGIEAVEDAKTRLARLKTIS